jgi:uncharacterized protein (TIGR00369 family)
MRVEDGEERTTHTMTSTEAEYRAFFEESLRSGYAPPLHRQMGLKIVELSPDTVLTMELTDEFRGLAQGSIHGGILAAFADIASAVSLWNAFDTDTDIPVTTDMHVRYYRQPRSGPLAGNAVVVHRGRRLLSTECSVTDAEQRILARSTATYMIVPLAN